MEWNKWYSMLPHAYARSHVLNGYMPDFLGKGVWLTVRGSSSYGLGLVFLSNGPICNWVDAIGLDDGASSYSPNTYNMTN
ncbi:hypothetical protein TSUD_278350 [Trifolium subterraneum]|uniref:Uncharacterized protein n=1 Tax=Trifolium subterraneum TaxID=3900 RepID=A0A2Z6MRV0_TRISU|nr:hypothetical protein TSUD_278350 [Trifolium subterraneum]